MTLPDTQISRTAAHLGGANRQCRLNRQERLEHLEGLWLKSFLTGDSTCRREPFRLLQESIGTTHEHESELPL